MARSRSVAAMTVAVVLLVAMAAMVQPTSAACGNVQALASCLGAAVRGTPPSSTCCQAMAAYAEGGTVAGSACLCQAITNPTAKAAGAKPENAILIPKKCNLNYKAGYVCNGMVVPGGHA